MREFEKIKIETSPSLTEDLFVSESLCVVLSPVPKKSKSILSLIRDSNRILSSEYFYASFHIGFWQGDQSKPYVVVEWGEKSSANGLEQRWLLGKLHEIIKNVVHVEDLVSYSRTR